MQLDFKKTQITVCTGVHILASSHDFSAAFILIEKLDTFFEKKHQKKFKKNKE
jgi:hypothetical protein